MDAERRRHTAAVIMMAVAASFAISAWLGDAFWFSGTLAWIAAGIMTWRDSCRLVAPLGMALAAAHAIIVFSVVDLSPNVLTLTVAAAIGAALMSSR